MIKGYPCEPPPPLNQAGDKVSCYIQAQLQSSYESTRVDVRHDVHAFVASVARVPKVAPSVLRCGSFSLVLYLNRNARERRKDTGPPVSDKARGREAQQDLRSR